VDLKKINEKLAELFTKHRIIFWNDANTEFKDDLSGCLPPGVEIIYPEKVGQFKTKVVLEIENPKGKFLVYSASSEPRVEEDWLLDIRLYGYQFCADSASMIVEELGLQHLHLREHIAKRTKFFSSKQRCTKLQAIIASTDMEKEIDRKLLVVLAKADHDRFFDIIHAIYNSFPFDQGLDAVPEAFAAIEKMDMADVFWVLVQEAFEVVMGRRLKPHFVITRSGDETAAIEGAVASALQTAEKVPAIVTQALEVFEGGRILRRE